MGQATVKVGAGGRVVIPGDFREAHGIKPGDALVVVVDDHGLRLMTPAQAIRRAQRLVREHIAEGRSLSDELMAERREESQ